MRRNFNRNLHNQKVISPLVGNFVSLDKREINKEVKSGLFKRVYDSFMKIGRSIKRFFWGSDVPTLAFDRPQRESIIVPQRVIKKRKALRMMQRDSRRANRGK